VVSRCTWPGQWPRTSRATNTMLCGLGVHGHTRSGFARTHGRPCGRTCAWQTDCACKRSLGAD